MRRLEPLAASIAHVRRLAHGAPKEAVERELEPFDAFALGVREPDDPLDAAGPGVHALTHRLGVHAAHAEHGLDVRRDERTGQLHPFALGIRETREPPRVDTDPFELSRELAAISNLGRRDADLNALAALGERHARGIEDESPGCGEVRRRHMLARRFLAPRIALPDLDLSGARDNGRREHGEHEMHDRDPAISQHLSVRSRSLDCHSAFAF